MAGGVLPDAITAYRTYGDPKNPAIVFPTCYSGRLDSELKPLRCLEESYVIDWA